MITKKELAIMAALVAATYGTTARVEQRSINKAFAQAMADMKGEI